jgi:hypothetical protein
MSGEELNPQISQMTQMEAYNNGVVSPARSSVGDDEDLVAGFSQLVSRVAHLEALVHGLLNGEHLASELSRPTGRLAAGPRDGDFIPPSPTADVASAASNISSAIVSDQTLSADVPVASLSLTIDRVWREAPLPLRLKFVRELLPAEHPLQPVLKEVVGLEELRGQELETWLTGYPSLFADAVDRMEVQPACGDGISETLAVATLQEARQIFEVTIESMGIEWIQPAPGTMIGEEHEVVGEAEAPVPAGRVATVRRRGFQQHGKLVLPAQVIRSRGEGNRAAVQSKVEETIPAINRQPMLIGSQRSVSASQFEAPNTEHRTPNTLLTPWPDWLRAFQQRSQGCELATIKQLLARLRELAQTATDYGAGTRGEADLMAQLEPLLPLLGARYVPGLLALPAGWGDIVTEMRDGLLVWLREALDIVVISPEPGARCDAVTMQTSGVRRTAHAHEDGTVAKVERIGLRRNEHVLFRAQVLRYEIGGSYE